MTSRYGIEEARGRLGDLITAAQQGADIVLTRNGRPAARIIPFTEPSIDDDDFDLTVGKVPEPPVFH
jgi:prevent-host-death family protein